MSFARPDSTRPASCERRAMPGQRTHEYWLLRCTLKDGKLTYKAMGEDEQTLADLRQAWEYVEDTE